MEFNKSRWYVQWFFLSLRVIDRFSGNDSDYRYRSGTNLCHFMRVTLFWAPLVVAFNVALYGLVLAALVVVPLMAFGLVEVLSFMGIILLACAAIFLVGFCIWGAHELVVVIEHKLSEASASGRARRELAAAGKAERGPGFGSILWQYAVAVKRRICPIITFKQA